MNNSTEKLLIEELQHIYRKKLLYPFPSADSRKLFPQGGKDYENFVTHLDLYFIDIAGYCSAGSEILKWSKDKLQLAGESINKSFFEKHPHYKSLEPLVTATNTPDLHARLMIYEKVRVILLNLFSRTAEACSPSGF